MAHFRQAVLLRSGLLPSEFRIRTGRDAHVDIQGDCDRVDSLLYYNTRRSGDDEEKTGIQAQRPVHDTQPIFDHHKWRPLGLVYRTVDADCLEEWRFLCHL